jgi:hypothetical protein
MGQKSNPISLRLQYNNLHFDSSWFSDSYYSQCLMKTLNIQEYTRTLCRLFQLPEARINMDLGVKSFKLYSFFCIPLRSRTFRGRRFGVSTNISQFLLNSKKFKTKRLMTQKQPLLESLEKENSQKNKLPTLIENGSFSKTSFLLKDQNTNKNIQFLFDKLQYIETKKDLSLEEKMFLQEQQLKLKCFLLHYFSSYKGITLNNVKKKVLKKEKFSQFFDRTTLPFHFQGISSIPNNFLLSNNFTTEGGNDLLKINNKQNLNYQNYFSNFSSSTLQLHTEYHPFRVNTDFQNAGFLADEIVYFLEKKVSFSRLKNRLFREVENISWIRGIRIQYSGRVGGKSKKAQRAKHQCVKFGQTSLHVFDDKIDYASRKAATSFGSVGIKVWICYK